MGLGTISLPRQVKELTPEMYRARLTERIDRMVAQESPEGARYLLEVVEQNEPKLSVMDHPNQAGEILANYSDWLRERSGMPIFPVPEQA